MITYTNSFSKYIKAKSKHYKAIYIIGIIIFIPDLNKTSYKGYRKYR